LTKHCQITDVDGDSIEIETYSDASALISIEDGHTGESNFVSLSRNELLELKKAVDAAYKEIDT
jgi:hypothetical protein